MTTNTRSITDLDLTYYAREFKLRGDTVEDFVIAIADELKWATTDSEGMAVAHGAALTASDESTLRKVFTDADDAPRGLPRLSVAL